MYSITLQQVTMTTRLLHIDLDLHGAPMDIQVRLVNTNTNKEHIHIYAYIAYTM
jgi:hypothetical protein